MKDITNLTTEQLKVELKRREEKEKEDRRPKLLESPDFSGVIEMCEEYIHHRIYGSTISSDYDHYLFEETMKAFYGNDIFTKLEEIQELKI